MIFRFCAFWRVRCIVPMRSRKALFNVSLCTTYIWWRHFWRSLFARIMDRHALLHKISTSTWCGLVSLACLWHDVHCYAVWPCLCRPNYFILHASWHIYITLLMPIWRNVYMFTVPGGTFCVLYHFEHSQYSTVLQGMLILLCCKALYISFTC